MEDYNKNIPESESESESEQNSSVSSIESDDLVEDMVDDQESKVHSFIENYYETNYEVYEVNKIKDYAHENVWSVHYDKIYDRVYIFVAKIKMVAYREKTSNFKKVESKASKNDQNEDEKLNLDSKTGLLELEGLQVYTGARVDLQVSLQIWNLDDRVLKDKDHTKRSQLEKVILRTLIDIEQGMNLFQIMQFCKNKYQDHASLVQHQNRLVVPCEFYNIQIFNSKEVVRAEKPIRVFDDNSHRAFKAMIHNTEQNLNRKVPDPILVFSLKQFQAGHQDQVNPRNGSTPSKLQNQNFKQTLVLTRIQYLEASNSKLKPQTELEVDQQEVTIEDDSLVYYYQSNLISRDLHPLFVQRIEMSETYLVMFPTGLLLMVGVNPFSIQCKIQLGLRRDEQIIDHCYSVSQDRKHHCIWILDQKLQVWKCSNERSPSQVSWTLTREQMFSKLDHRMFFKQATSYEKFYMVSFLTQLKTFRHLEKRHGPRYFDFQIVFNENATKGLFVHLPSIPQFSQNQQMFEGTAQEYLESVFKMPTKFFSRNRIKIQMLFAKNQSNILNHIPERRIPKISQFEFTKSPEFMKIQDKSFKKNVQQVPNPDDNLSLSENEILEVQSLRNVKIQKMKKGNMIEKDYRQFLVRRKRCLELMYTNGLGYWSVEIPGSRVSSPFVITDLILSANFQSLIAHCSIPGTQKENYNKIFTYSQEKMNFSLTESTFDQLISKSFKKLLKKGSPINTPRNQVLDSKGRVYQIQIQLLNTERRGTRKEIEANLRDLIKVKYEGLNINVSIAKIICFKELLNPTVHLQRVMISDNARILMLGRIIIQLSKNGNEIQDIGCIVMKKDHTFFRYVFRSLLNQDSRKIIASLLKKPITLMQIVQFDINNKPLSPANDFQTIYLTTPVVDAQLGNSEGTSLIKMSTETLNCVEIYQSKYNIKHFTQFDDHKGRQRDEIQESPTADKDLNERSDTSNTIEEGDSTTNIVKDLDKEKNALDLSNFKSKAKTRQVGEQLEENIQVGPVSLNNQDLFNQAPNESIKRPQINVPKTIDRQRSKRLMLHSMKQKVKKALDSGKVYLSLLSQKQGQIFIEVVLDSCLINIDFAQTDTDSQSFLEMLNDGTQFCSDNECKDVLSRYRARLTRSICVHKSNALKATSELAWINNQQLILTLDNDFYLLTTDEKELHSVKNDGQIRFGKQYVNTGLFASVVTTSKQTQQRKLSKVSSKELKNSLNRSTTIERIIGDDNLHSHGSKLNDDQRLLGVQHCIQQMEIASLIRLAFVNRAKTCSDDDRTLLFFMPCEELKGGSIFQKLAFNFNVIKPYLEKVDASFLDLLNSRIRNVHNYLQGRFSYDKIASASRKGPTEQEKDMTLFDPTNSTHMYHEDLAGENAIDVAFRHSAIFCISAFVDSVLQINEEAQFKNCFDKALLIMIKKGLDVTELVNSDLFFAPIWTQYTLFSTSDRLVTKATNLSLQDLNLEDPGDIFIDEQFKVDRNMMNSASKDLALRKKRESALNMSFDQVGDLDGEANEYDDLILDEDELERHEIQFRYINLDLIQGKDKRALTKTLNQSNDLDLFEQESIQVIIDYKWETYAKPFFLYQLSFYTLYLIFYFYDMHTIHQGRFEREKDIAFWFNKILGLLIHIGYLLYEIAQAKIVRMQYFNDSWNFLQVSASLLYITAAYLDIIQKNVTDTVRILYVACTLLTLSRVLYLLRVFKELSFLVIMLAKVIKDLTYFMIVFVFFIFTFSQCYCIVNVDLTAYGRIPPGLGMFLLTTRSAFGDFSLIDPYQGFDLKDPIEETPDLDDFVYRHSVPIVFCTFLIFILQSLTLFMVFMNFIIAVISDSYNEVTQRKVAYDYRERVSMILEREIFFGQKDLLDQKLFPKILVVSQIKKEAESEAGGGVNILKSMKQFVREQSELNRSVIYERAKEQKEHFNNVVKSLEAEISKSNQNVQRVLDQVDALASVQSRQQILLERLSQTQFYDSRSSQFTSEGAAIEIVENSNQESSIERSNLRKRRLQNPPNQSRNRKSHSSEKHRSNFNVQKIPSHVEDSGQNELDLRKKVAQQNNMIHELAFQNKNLKTQLAEFSRPYLLLSSDPLSETSYKEFQKKSKRSLSKQRILNLVPQHEVSGEAPLYNSLQKRVASRNSPVSQNVQKIKYPANSLLPDPKRNGKNRFPKVMQAIHREDVDQLQVNNDSVISWEMD